jgi:hypothetical protein
VKSKVYLDKSPMSAINAPQRVLKKGRIPRQIYLDNGKRFVASFFKAGLKKYWIEPTYETISSNRERQDRGYHKTHPTVS